MSIAQIPSWFLGTDSGQKLIEAEERKRLEKRLAIAKELATLRKERDKELPKHEGPLGDAKAKLAVAHAAWQAALRDYESALAHFNTQNSSYSARESQLEHELRTTASAQIDQLASDLANEHQRTGRLPVTSEPAKRTWNPLASSETVEYQSTLPHIHARLKAIVAAMRRVDELRLLAISEDALRKKISELWDSLPAVPGEKGRSGK